MIDLTKFGFVTIGVTDYAFGERECLNGQVAHYYKATTVFGDYRIYRVDKEGNAKYGSNFVKFGNPTTTESELLQELIAKGMREIEAFYRKHKIDSLFA